MKLPNDFLDGILNSIDVSEIDFTNKEKSTMITIAYSVLLEYHYALRDELLKSGLDIGKLEFDK